jgi:phosphoribosylaminoimidazole carboxylase PurE protein
MKAASLILEQMGIGVETTIVSAHRTPERMFDYARGAAARGIQVIVAGAGGAAHLPGMVASLTELPVIGVPVRASHLEGLDSLLSIVQMPRGVPVATVAINNAMNAGLLAARIIGLSDASVASAVRELMETSRDEVSRKAERLESLGYTDYTEE